MSNTIYIENIHCDKCGSSDAVGIYKREDGSTYGNCFSCGEYIGDPYGKKKETKSSKEEVDNWTSKNNQNPKEIGKLSNNDSSEIIEKVGLLSDSSINKLMTRGISKETCEKFGVKSELNSSNIDIVHYYPHYDKEGSLYYCKRTVEGKKFNWSGKPKDLEFFGQRVCGSGGKMILVTEGACDALAVTEMLAKCDKQYRVCSVVNGASAALKDFKNNYEWINSFENIFLAFDQDEPGQKHITEISNLFTPNKVKNIHFSEKDPNAMLLANKHKEFLQAIFSAKESRPTGIVSVDDIYEDAITPPVQGKSFPWPTLTDVTYGYRTGEIWGIGAGSGCGKTEWFKEMINHTIYVHHEVAGVIFLEEPAAKTLKVLAGKRVNKRFHIPQDKGGDWTLTELKDGINDLKGKVFLFNHFGSKDWESIKAKIKFMVVVLGVKSIYLDHLTALVAQEDNEYKALNKIMEEMSSLCQELDCTIFYVSHLRKANGTPHEEGGRVTADQFKGSGAIVFWSNFLIGLERNQQATDEDERNTTTLRVLKDRNTGLATGTTFKLKYDHETGRWGELDEDEFNEAF